MVFTYTFPHFKSLHLFRPETKFYFIHFILFNSNNIAKNTLNKRTILTLWERRGGGIMLLLLILSHAHSKEGVILLNLTLGHAHFA